MWITSSLLLFFVWLQVEAFFDWNLQELRQPTISFSCSAPTNALKVTPLLLSNKNREARKRAQVKPFAGKVKSFAGFFTVNEAYDSNMYFWYFLSEKNANKAPLILWLHGGPGQSSMMGLFEESGPYKIVNGNATLRKTSWTENYNVLYVDNPIGAGFSYTRDRNGYSTTINEAVDNLYEMLVQFYRMFPKYKKNPLYVAGQSYGGKYIPVLATLIDEKNKEMNVTTINLKGMLIGCGCLDPVNQIAFADYLYEFGIVDQRGWNDVRAYEIQTRAWLKDGHTLLSVGPLAAIGWIMLKAGYKMPIDINDPHIDVSSYDEVEAFVTRDDVRRQIHVGDAEFHDKKVVLWFFKSDLLNSVSYELAQTLKLGYKVLLYAGQFDMVIPHEQTDRVIENLEWHGAKKFGTIKAQPWYSNHELAGYTKSYANLQQVFVRKANHMIVRSQQEWMLNLLRKFTSG